MKKHLILLLKLLLPALVIAYLLRQLEPGQLETLRDHPKHWGLLALAFLMAFGAVTLSFARWWLLVRSLELPFRFRDALRLGFLGYLMNFIAPGSVGGDLFKAVFIAREQERRRAEAVATVIVDRVVGLYALLLVATIGVLTTDVLNAGDASVRVLCQCTLAGAVIGGLGLVLVMSPLLTRGRVSQWISQLPLLGGPVSKVIAGVRLYQSRPLVLVCIAVISLGVHFMIAVAIALIANALFVEVPTLGEHLVMAPLAMIANALPLTPGGLGALELALAKLYEIVPNSPHEVSGILVALVFRLTTFAIAAVGAVFYIRGRSELKKVLDEAERLGGQQATPKQQALD
ncbi:MAG: flippase-like domain-containing protein [Planctomycetales bacterium]|nr:flippase-like domain-containing protein [Planctomycetales bacterium]